MGQKHKDVTIKLKKKARYSNAYQIALTAHGYCSWNYLRHTPPSVLYKRIINCAEQVWDCFDSHRNKRGALHYVWESYQEVQTNAKYEGFKQATGVEGAGSLDCSMPENWGNALFDAVMVNGKWVRPSEVVSLDAKCYSVNEDNDPVNSDDAVESEDMFDSNYEFDGYVEADIEGWNEEGEWELRPENNDCCF